MNAAIKLKNARISQNSIVILLTVMFICRVALFCNLWASLPLHLATIKSGTRAARSPHPQQFDIEM